MGCWGDLDLLLAQTFPYLLIILNGTKGIQNPTVIVLTAKRFVRYYDIPVTLPIHKCSNPCFNLAAASMHLSGLKLE